MEVCWASQHQQWNGGHASVTFSSDCVIGVDEPRFSFCWYPIRPRFACEMQRKQHHLFYPCRHSSTVPRWQGAACYQQRGTWQEPNDVGKSMGRDHTYTRRTTALPLLSISAFWESQVQKSMFDRENWRTTTVWPFMQVNKRYCLQSVKRPCCTGASWIICTY